jgi:hypothetical protein
VEVPTGFNNMEPMINTNKVRQKQYEELFDSLWQERVKAGLMPKQDLTAWRQWMKKNQHGNQYPKLDQSTDALEFLKGDGTFAEFFDIQFIKYIKASTDLPYHNIPAYLSQKYPSMYARVRAYFGRKFAKVRLVGGTAVGIGSISLLASGFVEPVLAPVKGFIESVTAPAKDKASAAGRGAGEAVIDTMGLLTVTRPAPETVSALQETGKKLATTDFSGIGRAEARKKMEEFEKEAGAILPKFRGVITFLDKDFDKDKTAALKEKLPTIVAMRNSYDSKKSTLDTLSGLIESRQTPASPSELERIAYWQGKLDQTEDEISDVLAKWLYYRFTKDEKDKLDPAIDFEYRRLYSDYLAVMDVNKLRDKMPPQFEQLVQSLDKLERGKTDEAKKEIKVVPQSEPISIGK